MIVLTLLATVWFALASQLNPPFPAPTKTSQDEQQAGSEKARNRTTADKPTKPSATTFLQHDAKPARRPDQKNASNERDSAPNEGWVNWGFVNAFLTLVFAAIVAYASTRQWLTANQQAEYMREGLDATKTAADAAKKSADAATRTVDQMRFEQRTWLGVKPRIGKVEANQVIKGQLRIKNFGRTPGIIEAFKCSWNVMNVPVDFDWALNDHINDPEAPRQNVVAPDTVEIANLTGDLILKDEVVEAIGNNEMAIVLVVTLTYRDVTKHHRGDTQGCFVYDRKTRRLIQHEIHNHMH